ALQDGDAQLGFVQSDVMAYAYNGSRLFEEDGAITDFSTVAALYMEQVQPKGLRTQPSMVRPSLFMERGSGWAI
ncbi:MAG: hypothetical protein IJO15_04340, partial [Clostridia bacterium]|nr:hypothetical protein [Clostridia bacterium]